MTIETGVFIGVAVFAIVGLVLVHRHEKSAMRLRLAGRPTLTRRQLAESCLEGEPSDDDRAKAEELLQHVADQLLVDVGSLRPTDKFSDELRPIRGSELDSGRSVLFSELASAARRKNVKLNLSSVETLGDYVQQMKRLGWHG